MRDVVIVGGGPTGLSAALYLAGDAAHDVKFAIIAAAHGARAAHGINQALRKEDTD